MPNKPGSNVACYTVVNIDDGCILYFDSINRKKTDDYKDEVLDIVAELKTQP